MYSKLIDKLVYLILTKLYLYYLVELLSQFMENICNQYLNATYKVLKYIQGTHGQGLFYPCSSKLQLNAYSDNDLGACLDT